MLKALDRTGQKKKRENLTQKAHYQHLQEPLFVPCHVNLNVKIVFLLNHPPCVKHGKHGKVNQIIYLYIRPISLCSIKRLFFSLT